MNIIIKKNLNCLLNKNIFIKIINILTKNGKKTQAEKILLKILVLLKKNNKNTIKIILTSLENSKPLLILRTQKKRKITRIIPTPINKKKQINYGILNLINITKKKIKKPMHLQLLNEILNTYNDQGTIIAYKEQLYKTANENKLLTRYSKK